MNETNQQEAQRWIASRQDELVATLLELSAINSGTHNLEGLAQMEAAFKELFSPLADSTEVLASTATAHADLGGNIHMQHYGNMLSFKCRPHAPVQVLLAGHMDTVFPREHSFQSPVRVDDNTLNGPGVADMKGGILVMLTALQAFESTGLTQLGWQVLLNADEETGSHGSRAALAGAAQSAHAGLVYEPALADGTLARARKGSGNFTLVARGRAAHAGREFERGINAIVGLSEAMLQLAALSDPARGITVNVALIKGGTAANVVPDTAVCQFNVRCVHSKDQEEIGRRINDLVAQWEGSGEVGFELHGMFTRAPKEVSPGHQLLMDWLQDCGAELNIPVAFQDTGGCCDGNNLAAAGLPNIDTLGVLGGKIHTEEEFMLVNSLTERAQLSFSLLHKLAIDGEQLLASREASHVDS